MINNYFEFNCALPVDSSVRQSKSNETSRTGAFVTKITFIQNIFNSKKHNQPKFSEGGMPIDYQIDHKNQRVP